MGKKVMVRVLTSMASLEFGAPAPGDVVEMDGADAERMAAAGFVESAADGKKRTAMRSGRGRRKAVRE